MKMPIAPTPKKVQRKLKCKKCGRTFTGFPNSQYCEKHQGTVDYGEKKRDQRKTEEETFLKEWKKAPVKVLEKVIINLDCDCCGKLYTYTVYPDTEHVPRFCEEHRNEYKRARYEELHKDKK